MFITFDPQTVFFFQVFFFWNLVQGYIKKYKQCLPRGKFSMVLFIIILRERETKIIPKI